MVQISRTVGQRYSLCNESLIKSNIRRCLVLISVAGRLTMNLHSQYNVKILLIYMRKNLLI